MPESTSTSPRWHRPVTALLAAVFAACAALLLYSAYCQYTWCKLQLHDYGIYTNFLWNSAHGHWFRMLVDGTYLATHLSFTLLLVAPLFRIWDDPFLLAVVQWACGVGGGALVAWSARRHGLSRPLSMALAVLFLGHAYTQFVLCCEFHGVCLYLVLIPWLFHTLSRSRRWAWLPFLLLLGLREDAAFMILPLPLFFAVRDRWKPGYLLAALGLAYGIFAMKFLFPWLSGLSLEERRADLLQAQSIFASFDGAGLLERGHALLWLFLPLLLVLRGRAWVPAVVLPLASLLILMASPQDHHYGLHRHYAAVPYTAMVLGLIAGLSRRSPAEHGRGYLPPLAALLALVSYVAEGPLPGGGNNREHFNTISARGLENRWAASFLPRDGVLFTENSLVGFCANRADLITKQQYRPTHHRIDLAFLPLSFLREKPDRVAAFVASGEFGVTFFDYRSVILQRGRDTARNAEVLRVLQQPPHGLSFAYTLGEDGRNVFARGCGLTRHWPGAAKPSRSLGCTRSETWPAGRYVARFRLRAAPPRAAGGWGRLQVLTARQDEPAVEAAVEPVATPDGEFRFQSVPFEIPAAQKVQFRVIGEAAPLWLDSVMVDPAPAAAGT